MPVKVTSTVGKLSNLVQIDERVTSEIGTFANRRIRTRTESGRDVNGAPFAPLSESYAKARARAGVGTRSNLTLSGAMLNDQQVTKVTRRMATISFVTQDNTPARGGTMISRSRQTGANLKARMHNGDGRVNREFFALNDDDIRAITDAVGRVIDIGLARR